MAELHALTQAQAQLNELLEAARHGTIIPIRLPGQIEAIAALLAEAQAEHEAALKEAAANVPADLESYMREEAYFVGHAIHELRTPMTSIRGYSDMLGAMGELNDMQKQFLGTIKVNARRMESLMIDVSTMNKLRKNTLKLSPKMDMFKNIAMRLEKDFTPLATELKRQLVFDVPSGLPILNIDSDLLVQALGKLIENGLRYSPAETGVVTVRGAADGSDLIISISDNGIGMNEEELAKLGTIYFRSENDIV
ncbi:MAG: histidine kinase dimerization/phospho-acceptor domain-containing protein, partial [Aggregatilineales bacterium]